MQDKSPEAMRLKMKEYSTFIETVLKPELGNAESLKLNVKNEIQEYKELSQKLHQCQQANVIERHETQVDLGYSTLYCRAVAKDVSRIFVHVGMGFHVEFTVLEAIEFVEKRITLLERNLSTRDQKVNEVKNHLESAMLVFQQLEMEMQKSA